MLWKAVGVIVLTLLSNGPLQGEGGDDGAKRVRRFELGGSSSDAIMEATLDLPRHAARPADVVIRVCSREPLPLALSVASMNPFMVAKWMEDVYNYAPERILFLRSEDCLGRHPDVAATELWSVPRGAGLPPFKESIESGRVRLEPVGTERQSANGASRHRKAVGELIAKMRARPHVFGVVLGYYYHQPSPAMRRRFREVDRALKQSGLSRDRFFTRLTRWPGERSTDPPEPEPGYPGLFIVEIK